MKKSDIYRGVLEDVEISDTDPSTSDYVLDSLVSLYNEWRDLTDSDQDKDELYETAEKVLEDKSFSALDINTLVSRELDELNDSYFLSAAVNEMDDEEIEFQEIDIGMTLGYRNRNNIVLHNSEGHLVGDCMKDGKIIIKDDLTHPLAREMEGGEIIVEGDVLENSSIGNHMKGGKITLKGDFNGFVMGRNMEGGEIYIEGDINGNFYPDDVKSGEIYQKRDDEWVQIAPEN